MKKLPWLERGYISFYRYILNETQRCYRQYVYFRWYISKELFWGPPHNVKSDLIWRKYGPWWLYKAIAINPGASGHTKSWPNRLVATYRKILTWSHTQTEPDRTFFPKLSISLLELSIWGLISESILEPKGSNTLFFMQHGYMKSPGARKVVVPPKFLPPIFSSNWLIFYIVQSSTPSSQMLEYIE